MTQENNTVTTASDKPVTAYHEVMIGRTLYRVTSVYAGKVELKNALEDLTVSKALREAPGLRPGA